MLSIGEFSNICQVSTKTLRYYDKIGLIQPIFIHPDTGYRYYSIDQLKTMLLINRLKTYHFSIKEIKDILDNDQNQNEKLYQELLEKKKELYQQIQQYQNTLHQLNNDLLHLKQGESIMTYLDHIHVQLVEVPHIHILSIRKMILENDFEKAYQICFSQLLKTITNQHLTIIAPPMVLFHGHEFTSLGLDTEFAIPILEDTHASRLFQPGLCLKTTVYGSYSQLPSVYTKHIEYAQNHGFVSSQALYEVYVNDPSQVADENELITEVYYPVKKIKENKDESNTTK